jgi:GT2 family glycosyltransferase
VDAFWTANLSVKKAFLLENGIFDEDFRQAAGEDVELGMRLKKKGFEITYNPKAAVKHFHRVTFLSYCRRQKMAGRARRLIEKKHPEAEQPRLPAMPFWKKAVLKFSPALKYLFTLIDFLGVPIDPRWYDLVLSYYCEKGFREKTGE